MGIKFRCQACDKKLHVKSFLAGKRGVCPGCGAKIRIPAESQPPSQEVVGGDGARPPRPGRAASDRPDAEAAASGQAARRTSAAATLPARNRHRTVGSAGQSSSEMDPIAEMPHAVWYVRPASGGQFGPADGPIMRRWLDEGRVSADALVWREGWPDWKSAGSVFAQFAAVDSPSVDPLGVATPARGGDEVFPFGRETPVAERFHGRARPAPHRRHVAIVIGLAVTCVVLLAALYWVLRGQG